eukprot:Nitzschia sp. Nitz4//scaffold113_size70149//38471//39205//NITZ4_005952-RA/size70149-augustus-gene-0.85-mRNA-1//1//CDS//3329533347//6659//frame0
MGGCCSCCSSEDQGPSAQELELQQQKAKAALSISPKLSSPEIQISSQKVSGQGLALAGASIEQDMAYWEWHVSLEKNVHVDTVQFGVSGKKDRQFYENLKNVEEPPEEGSPSQINGTQWMRAIDVENGDVVGVAVQQSDLPMVQFTLNGEPLHISAINRFRGTVHPSIHIPASAQAKGFAAALVVDESAFKHESPGGRFGHLLVARSIV